MRAGLENAAGFDLIVAVGLEEAFEDGVFEFDLRVLAELAEPVADRAAVRAQDDAGGDFARELEAQGEAFEGGDGATVLAGAAGFGEFEFAGGEDVFFDQQVFAFVGVEAWQNGRRGRSSWE